MTALAWMAVGAALALVVVAWLEHDRRRHEPCELVPLLGLHEPPSGVVVLGVRPHLFDIEAEGGL